MRNSLLVFGLTLLSSTALADEQHAQIEVSGLWCPSCSYIVGEALKRSTSVEIVAFSPADGGESGVYTVSFDDALTNLIEIAAQPLEYGYSTKVLSDAISGS